MLKLNKIISKNLVGNKANKARMKTNSIFKEFLSDPNFRKFSLENPIVAVFLKCLVYDVVSILAHYSGGSEIKWNIIFLVNMFLIIIEFLVYFFSKEIRNLERELKFQKSQYEINLKEQKTRYEKRLEDQEILYKIIISSREKND